MAYNDKINPGERVNITVMGAGADAQMFAASHLDQNIMHGNSKYDLHFRFWNHSPERVEKLRAVQRGGTSLEELARNNDKAVHYDFHNPDARGKAEFYAPGVDGLDLKGSLDEALLEPRPDIIVISVPSTSVEDVCRLLAEGDYLYHGLVAINHSKGAVAKKTGRSFEIWSPYQTMDHYFAGKGVIKFLQGGFNHSVEIGEGVPQISALATAANRPKIRNIRRSYEGETSIGIVIEQTRDKLRTPNYSVNYLPYVDTLQASWIVKPVIAAVSGILSAYEADGKRPYNYETVRQAMIDTFMSGLFPIAARLRANPLAWRDEPTINTDVTRTAAYPKSRNVEFGMLIAQGMSAKQAQKTIGETVEAINQFKVLKAITEKQPYLDVRKLVERTYNVIYGDVDIGEAIDDVFHMKPLHPRDEVMLRDIRKKAIEHNYDIKGKPKRAKFRKTWRTYWDELKGEREEFV